MGFSSQLAIGRFIGRFFINLWSFISRKTYPKFKKGDIVQKVRPKHLEDWEEWEGSEPMEVLDVGHTHYKVFYEDTLKHNQSTYFKKDKKGNMYINWSIRDIDSSYKKIRVSVRFRQENFKTELNDILDDKED
jgi:hypothetical protein